MQVEVNSYLAGRVIATNEKIIVITVSISFPISRWVFSLSVIALSRETKLAEYSRRTV